MRRQLLMGPTLALVLALSAPAAAYTVMKASTTGKDLSWTVWPMKYKLHSAGGPGVSASQFHAAVRASYKTWDNVSCAYISFSDLGVVNQPSGNSNDHVNTNIFVAAWRSSWNGNALAFTRTYYDPNSGKILDADILYNPSRTWGVNGSLYAIDVQAVATHEIGHELGLNHSQYTDATMYYATGAGNTQQRSLHSDDINGVCFLYGNGKPKPPECTSSVHCAPNETCTNNKCVAGTAAKKGYGSPCTYSNECKSGICLQYGSNGFCSQKCDSAACPNNDKCLSLKSGGKACLPGSSAMGTKTLGQPCQTSMDCKSNICVSVPGKGYLCAQKCDLNKQDCPTNYVCTYSSMGGLCIPGQKPVDPPKKKLGQPCTKSDECASKLCATTSTGKYCTQYCDKNKANSCSSGYTCTKVTGSTKYVCIKSTPKKKALGQPCDNASECESGLCAGFGGSNACTKFCDKSSSTSCPSGYKCVPVTGSDKGACVKDTSKKKLGETCKDGKECDSGICAGEGFCTKLCSPNSNDCGAGFNCVAAGGGKHACLKASGGNNANPGEDEGGCSVAAPAPRLGGGQLVWLLLPLLLVLRRRSSLALK